MVEFEYRCTGCQRRYGRDQVRYLCPECGKGYKPGVPLPGVLEAVLDYAALARGLDRARPDLSRFCVVEERFHPALAVGNTPLAPAARLGAELGLDRLWVKNDGLNPSGSLKDRASFLVVAEARRISERRIVTASTGNAASALAAVCASTDREALIFVPASAPRAKLVQMVLYGARVVPVRGTYDDAFRLSLEYSARRGGLSRNTAYHPLTIEGKKTVGLEIWRDLGLRTPDAVVVSAGDGVILAGVHKAFVDLVRCGFIERLPRLICVQAETSDAIHRYIETGRYADAAHPTTRADSISVSCPSNARWARRAVKESHGLSLLVSDAEILEAQRRLAASTGIFAEPAAAAAAAGLVKLQAGEQRLAPDQLVVLLVTGHGLKDVDAPLSRMDMPAPVDPVLEAVKD
ncbi:MAG TPA: threonine synthase [Anaeromyxobacter sp.]|nr:threonine synthase [Anaeromyxobacter sp.]